MPTLGSVPKRMRIESARVSPAQAKRGVLWRSSARSRSQNASSTKVRAGESVSRLFPVASLANPLGKMPTKNGENASNRAEIAAGKRPTDIRPEIKEDRAECVEKSRDDTGCIDMVPEQKHASPYQRDQRGTKVQFGVVNLAAADDLGILKVNHLVPEMVLGNPPDANKERSGDEQKE